MNFAPILAGTIDLKKDPGALEKLRFPGYASPKIDGIRGVARDGILMSRKLIPLPRKEVQEAFGHLTHFDGEVTVGDITAHDLYNTTQSYVMSAKPKPAEPIAYHCFDWADEACKHLPYVERLALLKARYGELIGHGVDMSRVHIVEQRLINNIEELLVYEEEQLELGFEGIMYRSQDGTYRVLNKTKENRSSFDEGNLLKLKRFQDDEAVVVGFVEQMTNTNEAVVDNIGHSKRSSKAEGLVPAGTVGKIIVDFNGRIEHVGRGTFKKPQLQEMFDHPERFKGLFVKVRHFPHGAKDKWRQAKAVGFRDPIDF